MISAESIWRGFSELLYPGKCALCGNLSDRFPCLSCRAEMVPLEPMMDTARDDVLDFRAAIYPYEGRAAQAVRSLKYRRATSLGGFMADEIACAARRLQLTDLQIVPVPIHRSRRADRGFNQSEILAAQLPKASDALLRVRRTKPQAGLSIEQRRENLANAFRARDLSGQSILLIDDVVTTGFTARECARTLKAAGAGEVGILAFCGDRHPG